MKIEYQDIHRSSLRTPVKRSRASDADATHSEERKVKHVAPRTYRQNASSQKREKAHGGVVQFPLTRIKAYMKEICDQQPIAHEALIAVSRAAA